MVREVTRVTWNWQKEATTDADRTGSRLRRAALVQASVMGLAGAVVALGLGHDLAGRIIWILAGVVLVLGLLWPRGYRPIHDLGQWLGRAVGGLLRYLLLVPCYWLLFAPARLFLRVRGRDPLQRSLRSAEFTYWISRPDKDRDTNMTNQFLREDRAARLACRPVGTSAWTEREAQQ